MAHARQQLLHLRHAHQFEHAQPPRQPLQPGPLVGGHQRRQQPHPPQAHEQPTENELFDQPRLHTLRTRRLGLRPPRFQQVAVLHARRTHSLTRQTAQTLVHLLQEAGRVHGDTAFAHAADQRNAPAWRRRFQIEQGVGGARLQAEAATHTGVVEVRVEGGHRGQQFNLLRRHIPPSSRAGAAPGSAPG
ncbi:MAG: hypothetical protein R2856_17900 [Caldilineaceae bacterium]